MTKIQMSRSIAFVRKPHDAVQYKLVPSRNVVKGTGVGFVPQTISFNVLRTEGPNSRFLSVAELTASELDVWSYDEGDSVGFGPIPVSDLADDATDVMTFELLDQSLSGPDALLDRATVGVVRDGENGEAGGIKTSYLLTAYPPYVETDQDGVAVDPNAVLQIKVFKVIGDDSTEITTQDELIAENLTMRWWRIDAQGVRHEDYLTVGTPVKQGFAGAGMGFFLRSADTDKPAPLTELQIPVRVAAHKIKAENELLKAELLAVRQEVYAAAKGTITLDGIKSIAASSIKQQSITPDTSSDIGNGIYAYYNTPTKTIIFTKDKTNYVSNCSTGSQYAATSGLQGWTPYSDRYYRIGGDLYRFTGSEMKLIPYPTA